MSRARNYVVGSVLAAVAVGASLALFASGAGAAPAGSSITFTVNRPGVPDTTVGNTGAWEDVNGQVTHVESESVYGAVWAIDNISNDKFKVTPLGRNSYQVDRLANGTFVAFAQPNSGLAVAPSLNSVTGQLHGTNSYVVTQPVAHPLVTPPSTPEPLGTSSTDVLRQIFGSDVQIAGGDTWVFAYNTNTSRMVQVYNTDPSTWGNITG